MNLNNYMSKHHSFTALCSPTPVSLLPSELPARNLERKIHLIVSRLPFQKLRSPLQSQGSNQKLDWNRKQNTHVLVLISRGNREIKESCCTKGLTTLRQMGFRDVDCTSGNFSNFWSHCHSSCTTLPVVKDHTKFCKMDEDGWRWWAGARYFTWRQTLTLNSGTSTLKPTAVLTQEALHFSLPRCSSLLLVWYPFLQRQLHCTNTCHHRNSRACSGVSP